MADTLRRFRVELEAGSTSFTKGFKDAATSADRLSKSLEPGGRGMKAFGAASEGTSQRAGRLADTVGRVSTTLARSADSFGLPIGPLRPLDDVADVAEIGFKNLSTSMAGFNAASIGVAGAGLAIGAAIGTMLNKFQAVRDAADAMVGPLARLVGLAGEVDKAATEGLGEFSRAIGAKNEEAIRRQVEALKAQGTKVEDIAKLYKGRLSPALAESLGLTDKQIDAAEKGAKAQKEAADDAIRAQEQFNALVADLSGSTAQAEVDQLAKAFDVLGVEGVADLEALPAKLEQLEQQGAILPPELKQIVQGLRDTKAALEDDDTAWAEAGKATAAWRELTGAIDPGQFSELANNVEQLGDANLVSADKVEDLAQTLINARDHGAELGPVAEAVIKRWEGIREVEQWVKDTDDAFVAAGESGAGWGTAIKDSLSDALKGLPQVI